jgi:hypothetical protein
MLEIRRRLDLGQESLGAKRRGEIGMQHFDRDATLVFEIAGEVDRGHSALPEFSLEGVAIGKRGSE